MGILVRIPVLAPDDVLRDFGVGALIRLERAATEAGAYAEIATKPVVDGTYSYEIWDASGSTTHWYRARYSTAAPTLSTHYSGYGTPWSPSEPLAYANLDDLLLTMGQNVRDTRFLSNAEQKLIDATRDLDREIGYSALTETGTFVFHGDGTGVLHVHRGIVSLTSIDIRLSTGAAWTALQVQDTGWYLEGNLDDPNPVDGVYYHVRLIDIATYSTFPKVRQAIRLTGTLGGNPLSRKAACVAWARQRLYADPSTPGGIISGPEELAGAASPDRWPRTVYDLIVDERRRFWCHI